MIYTNTIEITLPRERVVQLLADAALRPKWLRGLVLHEPLKGIDGQVGSESRVVFQDGKQTMECIETITRREPADLDDIPSDTDVYFEREIVATGMRSTTRDRLPVTPLHNTSWTSEEDYRFTGPMRLIAPFMRGSFIKQSKQHMQDFKAFAEEGMDVREAQR